MDIEQAPRISKEAFQLISGYVTRTFGIHLPATKQNLVENRLYKRLRLLQMGSYAQYINHIFDPSGRKELELLGDFISTNKTYFYREPAHFEFVSKLLETSRDHKTWNIWSAACSGGDEAYTLSCIFEEARKRKSSLNYNILGTDISGRMIEEARQGSYGRARIGHLPPAWVKAYFTTRHDIGEHDLFSATAIIKKNVRFEQFNLIKDIPAMSTRFDIIFCRNVLIYFTDETKHQVVTAMISKLEIGGHLILGHCEGMLCRDTGLKQVSPAVFRKEK